MKQRITTGVIAALIFVPLVLLGNLPFMILIYLMASIALFEVFRMRKISVLSFPGLISYILLWVFLMPSEYIPQILHIDYEKTEFFFFGLLLFLSYSVLSKNSFSFEDVAFAVMAILYLGIGFYYMIQIRADGFILMLFALLLIWATDSGAYFVGRALGKRKLWPDISPNKTVEGFIGGLIFAMIIAVLFHVFTEIGDMIQLWLLLIYSVILSIFGQLGDLVESALKRYYNVKDSGNILPGHGGILDRVDSWLFVMPLLHFLHILS